MFKPTSRAGTPVITPPLRSEDSTTAVAQANAEALISAAMTAGRFNGTVQLPVGNIYFDTAVQDAPILDERHAGIVIRGSGPGKTVLIPVNAKGFNFVSRLVDGRSRGDISTSTIVSVPNASDYQQDEVIYFWNHQVGPDRSPRVRLKVVNVNTQSGNITHDGMSTGFNDFMHVKGFIVDGATSPGQPVPAGATSVRVPTPIPAYFYFFAPGDDVLLGDGPGINEFRGEWLTVATVDPETGDITFTTPTIQAYESNQAALVPGYKPGPATGRQHMSDITFQDLAIAAPFSYESKPIGLIRAGLRFTFDNVGFRANPANSPATVCDLQFVTCGQTSFRDVTLTNGRLVVGTSQNANFVNVTASAIHLHEYARDCVFTACRVTGPDGFTIGPLECQHIDMTNCTISGYGSTGGVAHVTFASDSAVTGVQLRPPSLPYPPDPVVITAQRLRLMALASGSPLTLAANSSGEMLTLLGAGQFYDLSGPTAAWDQPLTVRRDGVVRVPTFEFGEFVAGPELVVEPPTGLNVGLKVRCRANQAEDLQQWLSEDGQAAPLFAVRADGHLMTSKAENPGGVEAQIVKKLKVYLPDGSFRYLALYDDL